MGNPRSKNGHRRRELLKRVRAMGDPCWICELPIDTDMPAGHPLSLEVDELVPVSHGGSPTDFSNTAAAHRCCNNWRRTKTPKLVECIRNMVLSRFETYTDPLDFVAKANLIEMHTVPFEAAPIVPTTTW